MSRRPPLPRVTSIAKGHVRRGIKGEAELDVLVNDMDLDGSDSAFQMLWRSATSCSPTVEQPILGLQIEHHHRSRWQLSVFHSRGFGCIMRMGRLISAFTAEKSSELDDSSDPRTIHLHA